jgi:hypothetical protein
MASPYLIDNATNNPPAAPNIVTIHAKNDHPPKYPTLPPPSHTIKHIYTGILPYKVS